MKTKTFIIVSAITALLMPAMASARTHVSIGFGFPVYGGYGYWAGPYHHHYYHRYYAPVYIAPPPIIVPPPVAVTPAPIVYQDTLTSYVNVVNSNGSVTPVKIRRIGTVYVGPRGEQYMNYPTVEQLRPVYGF
jgi:hypothetical protein